MPYSVRDILSWVPLTKTVQVIKEGLPKVLPKEFFSIEEKVSGHVARVIEYRGSRQTARVVPYGSPAPLGKKLELSSRDIVLLSAREQLPFREELVFILRNWEKYQPQQKWAMQEIIYQGEQMRTRFDNLEVAALLMSLAKGEIYLDGEGNLLPNSSGAEVVISQGVPPENITGIPGNLVDSIIYQWNVSSTNIPQQIVDIRKHAVQRTGYPLKYAIYGRNVLGYMAQNDALKYFWARAVDFNQEFLETSYVPKEFLGLTWIPAAEAFFEDNDGQVQEIFGPDNIVFTPEITEETYTMYRGSELVPTSLSAAYKDGQDALGSLAEVFGRGRYAKVLDNPVQIIDVGFSIFLPRLKVPGAYYICSAA
jgi:hypothetical protein